MDDIRLSLTHYRPGGIQPRHSHSFTQISFLLSGQIFEQHPRSEWRPTGYAFGRKPAGIPHENRWGNEGVLIFSVELYGGELEATEAQGEPGWSVMEPQPLLPKLVRACILSSAASREEAMWDLLALRHHQSPSAGSPPLWLIRAREAIMDDPGHLTISQVARLAGIHRAHFSTTFRNYYGVPPSVFRQKVLVTRAISEAVCARDSLTRIAYDVGFSDQSHMSRLVRAVVGISPMLLRKFLA
jgi:AraC family transcriptional regulator